MLMTIIVTGGAGFIGSNFIFYMLKEHPLRKTRYLRPSGSIYPF